MRGDVHLVSGGPGTGKTILVSRFVYNACNNLGERAVYATFEESSEFFKRNLAKLGTDFVPLEKEGKVKIIDCKRDSENELVKDILVEPDIFGNLGLDDGSANNECAEVLTTNTIILSFYVDDFRRILKENPTMLLGYITLVNSKLQRLENRHADLIFLDTKDRLISFIKDWARSDGNLVGDKIVMKNYLTHSDIAGYIATSRQSVNMLLNELRMDGLLHYNRKHIELQKGVAWD